MTAQKYEARQRVKKRLSAYQDAKKEYKQVEERLEVLNARMISVGAQRLDGMPRGGSGTDPMPDMLDAKSRLVGRYMALAEQLMRTQLVIEQLIDVLDSRERMLMRYRYIDGMPWEQVCVAMDYAWRQTHRIHAKALDRLVERETE